MNLTILNNEDQGPIIRLNRLDHSRKGFKICQCRTITVHNIDNIILTNCYKIVATILLKGNRNDTLKICSNTGRMSSYFCDTKKDKYG